MESLSKLNARLDLILASIRAKAQLLPTMPDNHRQYTITHYSRLVGLLKEALASYYADKAEKNRLLKMLIMAIYQVVLMQNLASPDVHFRTVTGSHPGFLDLTELYQVDGVADLIINSPLDSFYDGPIVEPSLGDAEIAPGKYKLFDLTEQALAAERTEIAKRNSLNAWLNSVSVYNVFIIMFEQPQISSSHIDARGAAELIYIGKKAKQIITGFDLDVYIPTYLRD